MLQVPLRMRPDHFMDAVARKLNTDAHRLPLHAGEHATVISQQRHDGEYPELRVRLADGSWYDLRLVQFSEPAESGTLLDADVHR